MNFINAPGGALVLARAAAAAAAAMELVRTQSRDSVEVDAEGSSVLERIAQLPSALLKLEIVEQLQDKSTLAAQQTALTLQSTDFCACDAALTGGKGSSLAILSCIRHVTVPDFFLATTHAFEAHFKSEARPDNRAKSASRSLRRALF